MSASKHFLLTILLPFFMFCASLASANNIAITGQGLTGKNTTTDVVNIQLSLSWENSWFDTGAPAANANWDAAWVFAKFSKWSAATSTWSAWSHCTLSKTPGDRTRAGRITNYRGLFAVRALRRRGCG